MMKSHSNILSTVLIVLVCAFCTVTPLQAQFIPRGYQGALWITVPEIDAQGYGVYYFRKSLTLTSVPEEMPVSVSGDSRYALYVNGVLVSQGPAKSDLKHWNYEQVDLAPFLRTGDNVVAARVVNEGALHAESHLSRHTAFLLVGGNRMARQLDTDSTWMCIHDTAYAPLSVSWGGYMAVSPGDIVDMHRQIADWNAPVCDLSGWRSARPLAVPMYNDAPVPYGTAAMWQLQASVLPQMEMTPQRITTVRQSSVKIPAGFLEGNAPLTIPAHTRAVILLDQQQETNAFVTLSLDGGDHATVSLTYQESLYERPQEDVVDGMGQRLYRKSDRDKVDGMIIGGRKDSIICNGLSRQEYTTLTWRTFRYIQLRVCTADEPLVINDLYGTFTGYPFQLASTIDTDNSELKKILDIGWHTARLCAHETYMDCPYYEQLQYLGDTRIQALVTLYNTRDDRLVKNFLTQADLSRQPEGVTLSRYPSTTDQIIPAYSLAYILSLHDYMMYGSDERFVADKLPGTRQILEYYARYQQGDGRVKGLPWWNFSDWVDDEGWQAGVAPAGSDGCSALTDMYLLLAYRAAASLETAYGMEGYRRRYEEQAERLEKTIQARYWDAGRQLFADDAEHRYFSQHTNALAILADVVEGDVALAVAKRLTADKSLSRASVYFKFYLDEALVRAGLGDDYLSWLDIYRENMRLGLTTWAETSDLQTTRSDCHAWGASPNIEVYRTVLGIESAAPGFSQVVIQPHLGGIRRIGGSVPWRDGDIKVCYEQKGKGLRATVILPRGLSGAFVWDARKYPLHEGVNEFNLHSSVD